MFFCQPFTVDKELINLKLLTTNKKQNELNFINE